MMIALFLFAYTAGASLVGLAFVGWLTVFGWWPDRTDTPWGKHAQAQRDFPTARARCRWCAKACGVARGRG